MTDLSSGQRAFLDLFFACPLGPSFYLTGGTALAAFHLHHRVSHDLDLFTGDAEAPNEAARWMAEARRAGSIEVTSHFAQSKGFHNFRVVMAAERLRIDFCHDSAPQEVKLQSGCYRIDGMLDILANKVIALLDYPDPKHAVDLFFGLQRIALARVMAHAGSKRPIDRFHFARALNDAALTPLAGLRIVAPFDLDAYRRMLLEIRDDLMRELGPPG